METFISNQGALEIDAVGSWITNKRNKYHGENIVDEQTKNQPGLLDAIPFITFVLVIEPFTFFFRIILEAEWV